MGGCQFVGVGPCLKMSSDSYVDSILGVANLLGSFLKQLTDCYAETILGVANLQGSVFETAFRLLCRDCSGGLPICWDLFGCLQTVMQNIVLVAKLHKFVPHVFVEGGGLKFG